MTPDEPTHPRAARRPEGPTAEPDASSNERREEPRKCVIGEYCCLHGFIHGAEAEELRSRVEAVLDGVDRSDRLGSLNRLVLQLRAVLDEVDARDSCAMPADAHPAAPCQTDDAKMLDAALRALEALQAAGYYLHGPDGKALSDAEFYSAMTIGLNAALAGSNPIQPAAPADAHTRPQHEETKSIRATAPPDRE